jgi:hypothetical protein
VKRMLIILVFGVVAGLCAFAGLYLSKTWPQQRAVRQAEVPELAWLQLEFNLSEADFQRISELHLGYLPECEEMCRRIGAVQAKLHPLVLHATEVTSEIEALLAEAAELRRDCQIMMLGHFYAVSRAMPEPEGKRYLALMQEMTLGGSSFPHPAHGH